MLYGKTRDDLKAPIPKINRAQGTTNPSEENVNMGE
jgi:hypothetical protein